MSKVDHIAQGSPVPEWFLDAFQEFVSTMASGNFALSLLNSTTVQIVAGTDSDQVSIGIAKGGVGAWRYVTSTITAAVPGGLAAGTHDIYVTAYGNGPYISQAGPPSVLDETNYAFGLKLVQSGTTPSGTVGSSEELYRLVGHFVWDGAQITSVSQVVGAAAGSFAPLNSPAFTGAPTAPTPASESDNSTRIATTAWVQGLGLSTDGTVVHLATDETITGVKTFSAAPVYDRQTLSGAATLAAGSKPVVLTDTTASAFTITLPAAPTPGQAFTFIDKAGQWGTHNLTIAPNGKNLNGAAGNLVLSANYAHVVLIYDGTGWHSIAFSFVSPALAGTPTAPTPSSGDSSTRVATTAFVRSILPAGVIVPYGGAAAPTGWLLCDGSVVSQTTYAALYAVIGTAFNTGGEGVGNFRLPDMRGRVPVGKNTATFATLGATGGAETVTLTAAQIPSHTHSGTTGSENTVHEHNGQTYTEGANHQHGFNYVEPVYGNMAAGSTGTGSTGDTTGSGSTGLESANHAHSLVAGGGYMNSESANHQHSFTTDGGTGGGGSHTNLQPYQVTNYIVKT